MTLGSYCHNGNNSVEPEQKLEPPTGPTDAPHTAGSQPVPKKMFEIVTSALVTSSIYIRSLSFIGSLNCLT